MADDDKAKAGLRTRDDQTDRMMVPSKPDGSTLTDAFGPRPGEKGLIAAVARDVDEEVAQYEAKISAEDAVPSLVGTLLHAAHRADPSCLAPIAAIAAIAEQCGLDSLGLRLSVKDFAALRGLLTSAEQEEQARRWGGSELRLKTTFGFTRVTVADGA